MASGDVESWVAELFVPDAGTLTEGPRWDDRTGRLLWTDIYGGTLNSCDASGGDRRSVSTGRPLGSYAPRSAAGYVLALDTGFALCDGEDVSQWTPLGEHRSLPTSLRFNDGACDPAGRFFAGSMGHGEEPAAGALYRLDLPGPDGTIPDPVVVLDGSTVSNGIDWSPDGTLMYYVDSAYPRLDVLDYDVATGELSGRRPVTEFGAGEGLPDGLVVDAESCVWLAFWDGGVVRRIAPDGEIVGVVHVPVSRVSSCTFGGEDLRDLFITTASYQLSPAEKAEQPSSGSIFRCRPGATGVPVRRYAG